MIHSKLPQVGTTIFTVMSQMAQEHNAINLSQGFPDFPISEQLAQLVYQHLQAGHNQYAPMQGLPILREAIASKIERLYGVSYDPGTEIQITAGATQALFAAIAAVVNEGDEVLIFEPAYDSYVPAVRLFGGKPVFIQLKLPDYTIDWEQVKKAINAKTKLIILNSPHNPTGSILSADDLQALKKIITGTKIVLLSDEVYEHMVFDGQEHQSLLRVPELRERSIIVWSFGKTYHATGWKIGYLAAPAAFMAEIRKIHQFEVFTVNTPMQYALADYMRQSDDYLEVRALYEKKRDFFAYLLAQTPFRFVPTRGTYFQTVSFAEISDVSDREFCEWMVREVGVAAIPLSAFYHQKLDNKQIRFCFAKNEDTLVEAARRLSKIR